MATQRASQYKTVIVNGCELAYVAQGSGEPVIFVHGSISDLRIWDKQMAAFAENHRAIAYSRRYAWPNTEIPDGVDDLVPQHVDDLAQLIKKLDAAPAHLVGNSRGGFICLLAALSYPALVRTITVEEPPVIPLFVSTPPQASTAAEALRQAAANWGCPDEVVWNWPGPGNDSLQEGRRRRRSEHLRASGHWRRGVRELSARDPTIDAR